MDKLSVLMKDVIVEVEVQQRRRLIVLIGRCLDARKKSMIAMISNKQKYSTVYVSKHAATLHEWHQTETKFQIEFQTERGLRMELQDELAEQTTALVVCQTQLEEAKTNVNTGQLASIQHANASLLQEDQSCQTTNEWESRLISKNKISGPKR
jgi:hypothetical protein